MSVSLFWNAVYGLFLYTSCHIRHFHATEETSKGCTMKAVTSSFDLLPRGVHRQQWQIGLGVHGQSIRVFRLLAHHLNME